MKPNPYNYSMNIVSKLTLLLFSVFLISNLSYSQTGLTINAGADFNACENSIFLSGAAENYESVLWATNGDGSFDDATGLTAQYFPGENDVMMAQVELCLTAFAGGEQLTDCVDVSISPAPVANINVDQATICYFDEYTFEDAEILNFSAIQWFTSDGGGNFSNENIPNPTYSPSPFVDYAQGCIHINVIAQGVDPCEIYAEDAMELCFAPNAQVDLGGDTHYACYDESYTFENATASGTSFIQWLPVTGGGYFENANDINATYVPDPEYDYPQGCIYVLLMAEPISPCTGSIEEYAAICFSPTPEVDAGNDDIIFAGQTFTPSPVVSEYDNILWETSGDGTFDNETQLSPTYTPGTTDDENGMVTLSITAFSGDGCSASGALILTIVTQQQIDIPEGWSGISTFVNTGGLSFEEIIAPIADKLVYAQSKLQLYWPEYGINTIEEVVNPGAFKVYLNTAATLPLAGPASTRAVNLPAGWSLLPMPVSCPVPYQELIDQLGTNLIIVSEIGGENIIWPAGNVFTLTELMPGKAYMIKVVDAAQIEIPSCE